MTKTTTNQIPDGWTKTNLLDVADINPKEKLAKGTVAPYVAMERLKPFTRQISGFELREFKGGTKFRNGDTLIARITPCLENGKTSLIDILPDHEVGYGSTEFIVLREQKDKTTSKFLYYLAISPRFREAAIKSMTGTSGRQRVQTDLITARLFNFPPLPEQKAIAAVLSSLDDKIELLRKQNETLEAIAQAIFKEWFVNFNFPCLLIYDERTQADNQELMIYGYRDYGGLPAPQSGRYYTYVLELDNGHQYIGQTKFILKRFHEHVCGEGANYTKSHKPTKIIHWEEHDSREDAVNREKWLKSGFGRKWLSREKNADRLRQAGGKMIDSLSACGNAQAGELGEIPEGWRVGLYEDIAKVSTGKGLKKEFISVEGKYLVLGANGILGKTDEYLFDDDLILTGRVGTLGTVHISHNKVWISDNVLISKANHKELFYFAYFTLKRFNFESLNRGSTQPLITQTDIKNVNVVIPNKDILRQYSITTDHIFRKFRNNYDQIKTLTKLRDTLLPKLMSGQVRVKGG